MSEAGGFRRGNRNAHRLPIEIFFRRPNRQRRFCLQGFSLQSSTGNQEAEREDVGCVFHHVCVGGEGGGGGGGRGQRIRL
ncbi:hypothetical protein Ga0100231_006860 [Opitutaceae bacterium TAV4]|nr:hypothetical protein Ga0100231_006860 [Opitutaceae bacterium TAV4]